MKRLTPVLLLGVVLAGCSGDATRPAKPAEPIDPSLFQATVEVNGMS